MGDVVNPGATPEMWVVMANDYPDCLVVGSEAFADATAKARKKDYVYRNCGYGPDATGPAVERATRDLSQRMYWRVYKVPVIQET